MNNFKRFYPDVVYTDDFYKTIENTDCFVIITDWNEFKQPNWEKVEKLVKEKNVVDGRNLYNKNLLISQGFNYLSI
jgi:UDPglucose 6-dehydrogenase